MGGCRSSRSCSVLGSTTRWPRSTVFSSLPVRFPPRYAGVMAPAVLRSLCACDRVRVPSGCQSPSPAFPTLPCRMQEVALGTRSSPAGLWPRTDGSPEAWCYIGSCGLF